MGHSDVQNAGTVVSTTLEGPLDWPDATVVSGDAADVPLRSHGSLAMNRALMAAGLVDRIQVTLFPVITGQIGLSPVFEGAADFDLELVEHRTLDGHIQELIYRPGCRSRSGQWSAPVSRSPTWAPRRWCSPACSC